MSPSSTNCSWQTCVRTIIQPAFRYLQDLDEGATSPSRDGSSAHHHQCCPLLGICSKLPHIYMLSCAISTDVLLPQACWYGPSFCRLFATTIRCCVRSTSTIPFTTRRTLNFSQQQNISRGPSCWWPKRTWVEEGVAKISRDNHDNVRPCPARRRKRTGESALR